LGQYIRLAVARITSDVGSRVAAGSNLQ